MTSIVVTPLLAGAAVFSADPCFASAGSTNYAFDGSVEAVPAYEHSYKTVQYGVFFDAFDPLDKENIPEDGKNDVKVTIVNSANGGVIASGHSTDDIKYYEPRVFPFEHYMAEYEVVHVRFLAAFDRRDADDPKCETRTADFTMAGRQVSADPSVVCDKAPALCYLIDPGD